MCVPHGGVSYYPNVDSQYEDLAWTTYKTNMKHSLFFYHLILQVRLHIRDGHGNKVLGKLGLGVASKIKKARVVYKKWSFVLSYFLIIPGKGAWVGRVCLESPL